MFIVHELIKIRSHAISEKAKQRPITNEKLQSQVRIVIYFKEVFQVCAYN